MDDLYRFRDHYFESHPLSEADVKDHRVEQRMRQCMDRLDALQGEKGGKKHVTSRPCRLLWGFFFSPPLLFRSSFFSVSEDVSNSSSSSPSPSVRARALYHRGRALNVLPSHSPESERLLSRAVKLQPDLVDAWNELGESYAKRGDSENATTCFEGALRHVNIDYM